MVEKLNQLGKIEIAINEYTHLIADKIIKEQNLFSPDTKTFLYREYPGLATFIVKNKLNDYVANVVKKDTTVNYIGVKPNSFLSFVTYSTLSDKPNIKYPSVSKDVANKLVPVIVEIFNTMDTIITPEMQNTKYRYSKILLNSMKTEDEEPFTVVNIVYELLYDVLMSSGTLVITTANMDSNTMIKITNPIELGENDIKDILENYKDPDIKVAVKDTLDTTGDVDHLIEEVTELFEGDTLVDIFTNVNRTPVAEINVLQLGLLVLNNYINETDGLGELVLRGLRTIRNKMITLIQRYKSINENMKSKNIVIPYAEFESDGKLVIYVYPDNYDDLITAAPDVTYNTIAGAVLSKMEDRKSKVLSIDIEDISINKSTYNSIFNKHMDIRTMKDIEKNREVYKGAITLALKKLPEAFIIHTKYDNIYDIINAVITYLDKKKIVDYIDDSIILDIFTNVILKDTIYGRIPELTNGAIKILGEDAEPEVVKLYVMLTIIVDMLIAGLEPVQTLQY